MRAEPRSLATQKHNTEQKPCEMHIRGREASGVREQHKKQGKDDRMKERLRKRECRQHRTESRRVGGGKTTDKF